MRSPRTWSQKWRSSPFWHGHQPESHFHTFATCGNVFARMVAVMARQHGLSHVVDIGAGQGALAFGIERAAPELHVTGVDLRPAPPGFPGSWLRSHWDGTRWSTPLPATEPALFVALEWLDDLPASIVTRREGVWRHRTLDDGLGPRVDTADAAWLDRWWDPGVDEAEVGLTRDRAWAHVAAHAPAGSVLLMVDYGHLRGGRRSTFAAYRDGHGHPVTSADADDANLTAHVAIDAVDAAARHAGAYRLASVPLVDVIDALPAPRESADPLAALQERAERALLTSTATQFWWLCHHIPDTEQ